MDKPVTFRKRIYTLAFEIGSNIMIYSLKLLFVQQCVKKLLFSVYWAIPENIHTHPMDNIGNPVRNAQ